MAPENALRWALAPTGNGLRVSNASARYITIDSITLNGQKQSAGMVAPFSSLEIAPKGVALRVRCRRNSASPPSMITAR
jgi:P pilus assembly chaperone PapD